MFYNDGIMRKNKKSLLIQYLLNLATDSQGTQKNFKTVVFDGRALIHRLPWPNVVTMDPACEMYVDLATRSNTRNALKVVVFDNYEVATTKAHEKKRCRL